MICPYCKEKIKYASTRCKHCQADFTTEEGAKELEKSKKNEIQGALVAGAISLVIAFWYIFSSDHSGSGTPVVPTFENTCISSWDGAHINIGKELKNALKDPDSYEHVETRYMKVGGEYEVTTQYRAKNGFGAKDVAYANYTSDSRCNISNLKVE